MGEPLESLCAAPYFGVSPVFLFRPLRGHLPLGGRFDSRVDIVPSIYYFSYSYNSVEKDWKGNLTPENIDFRFLKSTSKLMLRNDRKIGKDTIGNDGLVDVTSAMYPKDEPFKYYDENEKPESGVWNVMPTRKGDHGTPIGLFADTEETHKFYDELMSILLSIE